MFDLQQAISDWQRRAANAGLGPAVVAEIESHLNDDIEQHMRRGCSCAQAFDLAVRGIGPPHELRTEFGKIDHNKVFMKRLLIIGNGVGGVLIGLAMVMPAVAQWRHAGAMTGESTVALVIGIVLTLGGAATAWCGYTLRRTGGTR